MGPEAGGFALNTKGLFWGKERASTEQNNTVSRNSMWTLRLMTSPNGNWSLESANLESNQWDESGDVGDALPYKKNWVCYSQEALPDVNHALNKRDHRRPKIKNCWVA
jgi:hypothetical protein